MARAKARSSRERLIARQKRQVRVGYEPRAFCFKCHRTIHSAGKPQACVYRRGKPVFVPLAPKERRRDIWEMPSGAVHFRGGGSFGSTKYDSAMDGIRVELIVCDECLVKHRLLLRHVYDETCTFRYNAVPKKTANTEIPKKALSG